MYTKDGPLYVNIRKSDGAKFQFHFPTGQFMNAKDEPITLKKIGLSKGLIEFYNNIDPLFPSYMKYDVVGNFYDGYARLKLNNKCNFIDTQGKLFSPKQWFDGAGDFSDGSETVKLNGKWYKIDTKGNIVTTMNEHTVVITKSDLRKIVLECVEKIRGII